MNENVRLSNHGKERLHERVGLSKKSVEKNALLALENGLTHSDTTGRLNKYITKLYLQGRNANNIRVYNHYVYLFAGNTLITVMHLPQNLCEIADKQNKRRINNIA